MAKSSSARNHRNNPYVLDRAFVRMHHSAAGTLFRFRTELAAVTAVTTGGWALAKAMALIWAVIILMTTATIVTVLPWSRRFIIRRAWCVLSRHRIQKVCYETRMHTRSGRLPLVLRIHPTQVGERALIWCRAGICGADFEAHTPEIAAACRWPGLWALHLREGLTPSFRLLSGGGKFALTGHGVPG